MKARAVFLLLPLVLAGVGVLLLAQEDGGARPSWVPPEGASVRPTPEAEPVLETKAASSRRLRRAPRARVPTAEEQAQAALRARLVVLWARAEELCRMQQHARALALLQPYLERDPAFFAEAERAALLATMRAATPQVVVAETAPDHLRELVAEIRRWGDLRPPTDDEDTALERRLRHGAGVIAKLDDAAQRERMLRHLDRFLVRTSSGARREDAPRDRASGEALDVDRMLARVQAAEDARPEPTVPLPIATPDEVEARRMAQLEALRTRGALTVLDALHAGLAWLALHQGEDGRFSDRAAGERNEVRYADDWEALKEAQRFLGHVPRSLRPDRYPVSSTALALMAFLDFRDQDARGLFEPTIARAVAWLRVHQDPDGLFRRAAKGRAFYTDAIALMALAQAAHATGDPELRKAVARGLLTLHGLRGPFGGYRYGGGQVGDVSVSAWVAQALEYAALAEVPIPEGMREDLVAFLAMVTMEPGRFAYVGTADGRGVSVRPTLFPAGMLAARILWDAVPGKHRDAWSQWLREGGGRRRPNLYTLYYGVRMDVWVHGRITERWLAWLQDLLGKQLAEGPGAGAFPPTLGTWTRAAGTTLCTALTLLTMEHALFSR